MSTATQTQITAKTAIAIRAALAENKNYPVSVSPEKTIEDWLADYFGGKEASANTEKKAYVRFIELNRVEGMLATCRAKTFSEANKVLREWSQTAPEQGGYDKTEVSILWENGIEYNFRYDLQHPSVSEEDPQLEDVIERMVRLCAGQGQIIGFAKDRYIAMLSRYRRQGIVALMQEIERTCAIGDSPLHAQPYTAAPPQGDLDDAIIRIASKSAYYAVQAGVTSESDMAQWHAVVTPAAVNLVLNSLQAKIERQEGAYPHWPSDNRVELELLDKGIAYLRAAQSNKPGNDLRAAVSGFIDEFAEKNQSKQGVAEIYEGGAAKSKLRDFVDSAMQEEAIGSIYLLKRGENNQLDIIDLKPFLSGLPSFLNTVLQDSKTEAIIVDAGNTHGDVWKATYYPLTGVLSWVDESNHLRDGLLPNTTKIQPTFAGASQESPAEEGPAIT